MTKHERRQKRVDQLYQIASRIGIEFDPSSKTSVRELLVAIMYQLDLNPAIQPDNGSVKAMLVDDNGYRTFVGTHQYNQRAMLAEATRLGEFLNGSGVHAPGDLSAIEISVTGRRILEHSVGSEWRQLLSGMIRDYYAGHGRASKQYERINDEIAFKVSGRTILVRAAMGRAKYQNGHIVIQEMPLPRSMTVGMPGQDVEKVVQSSFYGDALRGMKILKAESPDGTAVIQIDEQYEPAGGKA